MKGIQKNVKQQFAFLKLVVLYKNTKIGKFHG